MTTRIDTAFARMKARLRATPQLSERVFAWLERLSPTDDPAEYFRQRRTLPILTLPEWVGKTLGAKADDAFYDDLTYSTITGYCHIRLLDDVMDTDPNADPSLLPAAGFFHAEFQQAYAKYFEPEHPFWEWFPNLWFGAVEATVMDARLKTVTLEQFQRVAALKVSPAKIPIVATCLRHGKPDALPARLALCDRLGAIAQMTDDVFDWQDDLEDQGRTTYFLSEAKRRRKRKEPATAWILREGFAWGVASIESWYEVLADDARALGGLELVRHLDTERAVLAERAEQLIPGYRTLATLADVWPS
ncbi:MAG TPA: class 1 isoprenoid biosynthesis enzyme [Gemmatimonadales bacterium]|nr:class 1 isoprenoid biosynthesis enzyme [Gemmatimonadales bacterium]